ncbi:hypothetical protein [Streptomyces hygroscopicus]|uniref:hypothetical protein n=1 Tax=Streptomyces hygroscopicus TaxID=1912 RepID=UPI00223F2512|nr:hypothetical protein [Streptomyces hygroscopicus]
MPASIRGEVQGLLPVAVRRQNDALLDCPSCGSSDVAQVLGDNGGISFVCTACGHSWS